MNLKKGIAAVFIVTMSVVVTAQISSHSAGRRHRPPVAGAVPSVATKKDGHNFHQQRLIALFGSETQPVYGNRDPTTGRIMLVAAPSDPTGSAGSNNRYSPDDNEEASAHSHNFNVHHDQVDRKDTKVSETNEINPFDLLPPQFHDLLNIPIHDYGNGTIYNPYDKYKQPSKNKYPLVSTGYANTKYQGSTSSTTIRPIQSDSLSSKSDSQPMDDYDDYAPIKTSRRPVTQKPRVTTTSRPSTVEDQQLGDYSNHYVNRLTTKKQRIRPLLEKPQDSAASVYRPNKPQVDNTRKPARPYDNNNLQSESSIYREQVSAFRPPEYNKPVDNRPETKPELRPLEYDQPEYNKPSDNRPENKPDKRPFIRPPYQHEEQEDDWSDRPQVSKPNKPSLISHQGGFRPVKTTSRPKPTHDDGQPQSSRPNYSDEEDSDLKDEPIFITNHQSYRPDEQIAEIKVTPKPFYAVDENQNFNREPSQKTPGLVDDEPDIIYDYDDDRNKGDGVFFMVDSGPSGVAFGPDISSSSKPVTQSPVASPYPTVASREPRPQHIFNPAFRPSAPVLSEESKIPGRQNPLSFWSQPQLPPVEQKQQSFSNNQPPRPHFRFPTDQQQIKAVNQPPSILPLFRPNSNPTDEFQFIKHPQQIEFQRQQPNQPPGQFLKRPVSPGQEGPPQRHQQRPIGLNPLPSALQSPFSSISQSVANFFIRRSGKSYDRSSNLNPTVKMDRSENTDPAELNIIEMDGTGWEIHHPTAERVAREADNGTPTLYTPNNSPLLVGPSGGTGPFKPILSPEIQRRSRPNNFNNPPLLPTGLVRNQEEISSIHKPFFPISSNNKLEIQTSGWSPTYHNFSPLSRQPPFHLTETLKRPGSVIPTQRVSLTSRKDASSAFFSNPTLLHNNPSEWSPLNSALFQPQKQMNNQDLAAKASSNVVSSFLNFPQVEETLTQKPLKRKTTKSPTISTTPAYVEKINNQNPASYATIQQEDGKHIAVVHPAYIVTYKSRSGSPELVDLDIPFIPSVESPSSEGELTSIPFEKWHVMPQEIERKDEVSVVDEQVDHSETTSTSSPIINSGKLEYFGGFIPVNPTWN